jgi:hypothetical protein
MLNGAGPIASADVRRHLEKILASDGFVRSERLSRFLRYVVETTLEGRLDELKEYIVGLEVYHKGPDFDPRMDTAVRVDARRLRARLDEYYAGPGAGDAVRILLPKGGYVPVFSPAGAPETEMVWRPVGRPGQGRLAVLIMFLAGAGLCAGHWPWRTADSAEPAPKISHDSARNQASGGGRLSRGLTEEDEFGDPGFSPAHSVLAGSSVSLADLKPASGPHSRRDMEPVVFQPQLESAGGEWAGDATDEKVPPADARSEGGAARSRLPLP